MLDTFFSLPHLWRMSTFWCASNKKKQNETSLLRVLFHSQFMPRGTIAPQNVWINLLMVVRTLKLSSSRARFCCWFWNGDNAPGYRLSFVWLLGDSDMVVTEVTCTGWEPTGAAASHLKGFIWTALLVGNVRLRMGCIIQGDHDYDELTFSTIISFVLTWVCFIFILCKPSVKH